MCMWLKEICLFLSYLYAILNLTHIFKFHQLVSSKFFIVSCEAMPARISGYHYVLCIFFLSFFLMTYVLLPKCGLVLDTVVWNPVKISLLILFHTFSPLWLCGPTSTMASHILRFLAHTQWHATFGRAPLDKWSACRRVLFLTPHNTHSRLQNVSRNVVWLDTMDCYVSKIVLGSFELNVFIKHWKEGDQ